MQIIDLRSPQYLTCPLCMLALFSVLSLSAAAYGRESAGCCQSDSRHSVWRHCRSEECHQPAEVAGGSRRLFSLSAAAADARGSRSAAEARSVDCIQEFRAAQLGLRVER